MSKILEIQPAVITTFALYEQKAVIVLLALLHLGVKNIHLGPTLPAFLSPNVAKVLVDNFGIAGISNVEDDIKNLIGKILICRIHQLSIHFS